MMVERDAGIEVESRQPSVQATRALRHSGVNLPCRHEVKYAAMPEEKPNDDVEKYLADLKSIEDRKQTLIADLLRQRTNAIKIFDDKLAKLGWEGPDGSGKTRKSHHRQVPPKPAADAQANAKGKTKA